MDEDFLHLFEESPALRLMRGRLGSFVVGFFLQNFQKVGSGRSIRGRTRSHPGRAH